MANSKGQSSVRDMVFNGRTSVLPPKVPFPSIPFDYPDCSAVDAKAMPKQRDVDSHHHRTFSENLLIEDKPSWLDDLLDEPETPLRKGSHRRSSSDSFTYTDLTDEGNTNSGSQDDLSVLMDSKQWGAFRCGIPSETANGLHQQAGLWSPLNNADRSLSLLSEKDFVERGYGDTKPPPEKDGASNSKSSEADEKHTNQKYAQRSRVRKLQYIAELERKVQALQAEGSEASAELEFTYEKNFILSMENKALKQRLESLAQEQLIKYMEHDMLEREVGRLIKLYQQQQQTSPSPSLRHASSRDLEQKFGSLSLKHKEAGDAAPLI